MDYCHTNYAKLWREEVERRKQLEAQLAELRAKCKSVEETLRFQNHAFGARGFEQTAELMSELADALTESEAGDE